MKIIFTKNQAISALKCIEQRQEIELFLPLDPKDKKNLLSCEELEKRLRQYVDAGQIAGVVENPVDLTPKPKTKKGI